MEKYEINEETLAIVSIDSSHSKVIEKDREFIIETTPMDIINNSCLYFGSSYEGRYSATKYLLGISYKSPIIIEESKNIIFFPTTSPRLLECNWISLKDIVDYKKDSDKSIIKFENGYELSTNISYGVLDNQILRATRLESLFRNKKNNLYT